MFWFGTNFVIAGKIPYTAKELGSQTTFIIEGLVISSFFVGATAVPQKYMQQMLNAVHCSKIQHIFSQASKVNHASLQHEVHPRRPKGGPSGRAKNLEQKKSWGVLKEIFSVFLLADQPLASSSGVEDFDDLVGFSQTYIAQGPVVQNPISTNPGLTLNKTYRVNPGLALIGLWTTGPRCIHRHYSSTQEESYSG